MNLLHLKALCEVVDQGLHLSKAAQTLHRSQPALTRQIQQLESELGVALFVRNRSRIISLTEQGNAIVQIARRLVADALDIGRVAQERVDLGLGELTVATTHTLARYTLLPTIKTFIAQYRGVVLNFKQGTGVQCCDMVARGVADIGICTQVRSRKDVVQIPCGQLQRIAVVPPRHPLLRVKPLTLEAIARYPVIIAEGDTGQSVVDSTFRQAGLAPRMLLSAINADLSKGYVEMGMGVGIMVSVAFDEQRDKHLRKIDVNHLFPPTRVTVTLRSGVHLRSFTLAFLQMYAPKLTAAAIRQAVSSADDSARTPARRK